MASKLQVTARAVALAVDNNFGFRFKTYSKSSTCYLLPTHHHHPFNPYVCIDPFESLAGFFFLSKRFQLYQIRPISIQLESWLD